MGVLGVVSWELGRVGRMREDLRQTFLSQDEVQRLGELDGFWVVFYRGVPVEMRGH